MHDRDTSHANPLAAPIEREPSDPEATAIEDVREIRRVAYEAGELAGYERGQAAAQTMIDAATAETATARERERCAAHVERLRGARATSSRLFATVLGDIVRGEAAP